MEFSWRTAFFSAYIRSTGNSVILAIVQTSIPFTCASQKSPGNPGFDFPDQDNHITARFLPGYNSPHARFLTR
jgi:hypothetical protein